MRGCLERKLDIILTMSVSYNLRGMVDGSSLCLLTNIQMLVMVRGRRRHPDCFDVVTMLPYGQGLYCDCLTALKFTQYHKMHCHATCIAFRVLYMRSKVNRKACIEESLIESQQESILCTRISHKLSEDLPTTCVGRQGRVHST